VKQNSSITVEARIHPGSTKRGIEYRDGTCHIYTHAKPVAGKANDDAVKLVAEHMGVRKRNVTLIKGEWSKIKVFEIKQNV
jgi:uncharacterized protein YggU (UPF0235/DUF167 family)